MQIPQLNSWEDVKVFFDHVYESKSVHTVGPTNMLESVWISIVQYLGDFHLLVAFYFFMNVCYMIGAFIFWVCDRFHLLHKYKIQKQKYPNTPEYLQCAMNLFQNYILIIFPLLYTSYPLFTFLGFSTALPLPSIWTFLGHFAFCVFAEDVAHYCLHRLLHTPYLYKRIHKVHHQYSAPFGLAASYAHPAEVLILGFATFLGPLIVRPHFFTFYCWVLYRQLDAVMTHSGYDLPINPLELLPFYGGTKVHDYHHKSFIYNYSSRFTFMDLICGTYREASVNDKGSSNKGD